MKKILLLIHTIALIFVLSTCKKDKTNWPTEWYVPQEMLDYFYFRPNSMWVYENDKTGKLDTVIVRSAKRSTFRAYYDGRNDLHEEADIIYESWGEGYSYDYYCNTFPSANCTKSRSNHPCYSLICAKYKPGNVLGESISWSFPFQKDYGGNEDFSSQKSEYRMKEYFDSLVLNKATYYKVFKVNITNALIDDRHDINIYWAKDFGIIKKEILNDSQSWNLIYSQIVR